MNAPKLIDIVLVGALSSLMLALTGCPDDKDSSESDPGPASRGETSGGETGPKPQV